MSLPPSFFLYISGRHSKTDPFSGFILCNATQGANLAWTITPRLKAYSDFWTVQCPAATPILSSASGKKNTLNTHTGTAIDKRIYTTMIWPMGIPKAYDLIVKDSSGASYPVLEITKHTAVFGSYALKRNVLLQWLSDPLPTPAPATTIQHVAPAPGPQTVAPASSLPKKAAAPKLPVAGDLHLFVAKQLLEFAQSKHEMCPITAEEYITGQTAAMPCGHLFMKMAIEETFKKEPNKCPACRQAGRPTFV